MTLGIHLCLARPRLFGRAARAVVVAAEPPIPGHFDRAVVALEIPVVQLVEIDTHPHLRVLVDHQFFETGMRKHGMGGLDIAVEHHVERVAGHNQMDREIGIEQRVFHRMH